MTLLLLEVKTTEILTATPVLREEYLVSKPSSAPTFEAGPSHTQQGLTLLCHLVLDYAGSQKGSHYCTAGKLPQTLKSVWGKRWRTGLK